MNETRLHTALRRITADLAESGASCAVVGGLFQRELNPGLPGTSILQSP